MNVSISTVAADLGTTISGMQAAITLYALTMAAFMLTGGKLGDKWGKLRAFKIGSVVYGIGSLLTALAPNVGFLMFGWSLVEGLGAILVIPAIAALAAVNYTGKDRIAAFALLGAVTGLAAAAGPIIGGFVTTYFSWRYVFIAETIVMIGVLLVANRIADSGPQKKTRIDVPSSALSVLGMSLLVFGVLQSKTWGWIEPLKTPTINGVEIAPFGISIVAYLILAGIFTLWLFIRRQKMLERDGDEPLLKMSLLSIRALRSGLAVFMSQYFTIAALFFVVPVYLQTVLGYDALQTGLKMLPLSVGLILFSIIGSRMSLQRAAISIARYGQIALALGCLVLLAGIGPELNNMFFWIGMFIIGAGFGLLASQLGNVNMSAVPSKDTAAVGGLQGTFQNLGTSFGTAVVGSVFVLGLTASFTSAIQSDTTLSATTKSEIGITASTGVPIVSADQVSDAVLGAGASTEDAEIVAQTYSETQIDALRQSVFVVFIVALLSIILSAGLPRTLNSAKSVAA